MLGGAGARNGLCPVPRSEAWRRASTSPFSLPAESKLLNKLSVPAHFVALTGGTLNVNLKTGTEVSARAWAAGAGPLGPPECLSAPAGLAASSI